MPVFTAGSTFAHIIADTLGVPVFEYSHQDGHIMAGVCSAGDMTLLEREFYAVHLSGGTLEILRTRFNGVDFDAEIVGRTLDISAGQLIDRAGVALGMKFPCGAAVDAKRGTVVVDLDDPAPYELAAFGKGVLHLGDILFFYRNLAENAVRRAYAFQAAHALERSPAITSGSAPGR